jgi:predicted phosphoadenosine phosphosulfate sulfurtransferase
MLLGNEDILEIYRICYPISAQCATSVYEQSYRTPWEEEKKDIWVRDMPKNGLNIHNSKFDFFEK